MIETARAAPTSGAERLEVVDALRGFAVFGILLVNMQSLSSSGYRSEDGARLWTGTPNRIAAFIVAYGASGKFMILFTVLFGLGVALMQQRATVRNLPVLSLQARRLLVLFGIGLIHAFCIWYGDILVTYALAGALLLLFRRCRPRTLLIWAIALNLVSFATNEMDIARSLGAARQQEAALHSPTDPVEVARAYGRGTFSDIMRQRAEDFWRENRDIHNIVLRRLSFFLVGLFVGRIGFLTDLPRHREALRHALRWALAVGLLAHLATFVLSLPQLPRWTRVLRLPTHVVGNPALAGAYAIGFILVFQKFRLRPLVAVGRTALSNYLLQSVVCTTIFYSYGLGLYGELGPAAGVALSVLIFSLQVPASVWWTGRFQFGPAEWIWRSLAYGGIQPLRLRK